MFITSSRGASRLSVGTGRREPGPCPTRVTYPSDSLMGAAGRLSRLCAWNFTRSYRAHEAPEPKFLRLRTPGPSQSQLSVPSGTKDLRQDRLDWRDSK